MQSGEIVLVDNYRVLHGRETFEGDRYHAVAWFGDRGPLDPPVEAEEKKGSFMNEMINKYVVDAF